MLDGYIVMEDGSEPFLKFEYLAFEKKNVC